MLRLMQKLMLVDWVSHASFEVFPIGFNDPRDGSRKLVIDPEHPVASIMRMDSRLVLRVALQTLAVLAGERLAVWEKVCVQECRR